MTTSSRAVRHARSVMPAHAWPARTAGASVGSVPVSGAGRRRTQRHEQGQQTGEGNDPLGPGPQPVGKGAGVSQRHVGDERRGGEHTAALAHVTRGVDDCADAAGGRDDDRAAVLDGTKPGHLQLLRRLAAAAVVARRS